MQVKVMNLNIYPYKEKFRERMIEIPANGYVLMDEDEADYFCSTFTFPVKDAQNRPDPVYFKKLKIEYPPEYYNKKDNAMVCHANGQTASSAEELAKILGKFSHMLADKEEGSVDAEAIKAQNKELRKENKVLKTRLEIIEEKLGLRTNTNEESV